MHQPGSILHNIYVAPKFRWVFHSIGRGFKCGQALRNLIESIIDSIYETILTLHAAHDRHQLFPRLYEKYVKRHDQIHRSPKEGTEIQFCRKLADLSRIDIRLHFLQDSLLRF